MQMLGNVYYIVHVILCDINDINVIMYGLCSFIYTYMCTYSYTYMIIPIYIYRRFGCFIDVMQMHG